jgi:hypothetical protein
MGRRTNVIAQRAAEVFGEGLASAMASIIVEWSGGSSNRGPEQSRSKRRACEMPRWAQQRRTSRQRQMQARRVRWGGCVMLSSGKAGTRDRSGRGGRLLAAC